MRYLYLVLLLILSTVNPLYGQSSPTSADRIVALVNDQIILKSDIDQSVTDYIRQASFNQQEIPFTKNLWYSFLEAEIDSKVLIEKAKIDSIIVTDSQVNQQMDARVSQLIQQAGSEQALEQSFGKSIIQLKADFRETFREQITAQRVRQLKVNEIDITRDRIYGWLHFINSIEPNFSKKITQELKKTSGNN